MVAYAHFFVPNSLFTLPPVFPLCPSTEASDITHNFLVSITVKKDKVCSNLTTWGFFEEQIFIQCITYPSKLYSQHSHTLAHPEWGHY